MNTLSSDSRTAFRSGQIEEAEGSDRRERLYLNVFIRGTTPLLMVPNPNAERTVIAKLSQGNPSELLVRHPQSGDIVIPGAWFKRSVRIASSILRLWSHGFKDAVRAHCLIGGFASFGSAGGWTVYSHLRHLRGGSLETGLIRCPQFNNWTCTLLIPFEKPMTAQVVQRLIGTAGRDVGIGLFSVEQHGPYGKFQAEKWEWSEKPPASVSVH